MIKIGQLDKQDMLDEGWLLPYYNEAIYGTDAIKYCLYNGKIWRATKTSNQMNNNPPSIGDYWEELQGGGSSTNIYNIKRSSIPFSIDNNIEFKDGLTPYDMIIHLDNKTIDVRDKSGNTIPNKNNQPTEVSLKDLSRYQNEPYSIDPNRTPSENGIEVYFDGIKMFNRFVSIVDENTIKINMFDNPQTGVYDGVHQWQYKYYVLKDTNIEIIVNAGGN